MGGTILGTVNRGNPFADMIETSDGPRHYSDRVFEMFHKMGLGALVVIGGDGTLGIAHEFCKKGIPIVGVPKTIDNDIVGTTNCFGFDTAVDFATDAIDRLHSTAEAHRRIMVVEVMGRHAGWIALYAGVAGGADAILIPEIPFDIAVVAERLRERDRWGAHFSIVVVAEGAFPRGGTPLLIETREGGTPNDSVGSGRSCARRSIARPERRPVPSSWVTSSAAATPPASTGCWRPVWREGRRARQTGSVQHDGRLRPTGHRRPAPRGSRGEDQTVPHDFDLLLTAKAIGVTFGD